LLDPDYRVLAYPEDFEYEKSMVNSNIYDDSLFIASFQDVCSRGINQTAMVRSAVAGYGMAGCVSTPNNQCPHFIELHSARSDTLA